MHSDVFGMLAVVVPRISCLIKVGLGIVKNSLEKSKLGVTVEGAPAVELKYMYNHVSP